MNRTDEAGGPGSNPQPSCSADREPVLSRRMSALLPLLQAVGAWSFVGLVAGWLTSQLMKRGRLSVVEDVLVGLVGGVLGGAAYALLVGDSRPLGPSTLAAAVGALVLFGLVRILPGRAPI